MILRSPITTRSGASLNVTIACCSNFFCSKAPNDNARRGLGQVPARTPESDAMSKDLKKRGFTFVGTNIRYAFMQAVGMVNDHRITCFHYREV